MSSFGSSARRPTRRPRAVTVPRRRLGATLAEVVARTRNSTLGTAAGLKVQSNDRRISRVN
jgi:hypothetical protein